MEADLGSGGSCELTRRRVVEGAVDEPLLIAFRLAVVSSGRICSEAQQQEKQKQTFSQNLILMSSWF